MTYTEIEKLCDYIMNDESISKDNSDSKDSELYRIYNGLCREEGILTGSLFIQVMDQKYNIEILVD